MVNMAVNDPEIKNYDLTSLRKIMYGASPMPEPVIVKAMEMLPNCTFIMLTGKLNVPSSNIFRTRNTCF